MRTRIISGVIGAALVFPIFWFSDTWVFPIVLALATLISSYEMLRCIGVHRKYYFSLPVLTFSTSMPLVAHASQTVPGVDLVFVLLSGVVVFVLYLLVVSLFSKGDFKLPDAAMVFMTEIYIIGGYTSVVLLRDFGSAGQYIYLFIFLGAWSTDIFAYFVGRAFGRHKLIPDVSPKKTVEGSIGGVVFCVLTLLCYAFVLERFFGQQPNYLVIAIIGLVISCVAQIGDLMMSQIKRSYGIKDFGKIMPGHGGLLDRFDSGLSVSLILIIACEIVRNLGGELFLEVL